MNITETEARNIAKLRTHITRDFAPVDQVIAAAGVVDGAARLALLTMQRTGEVVVIVLGSAQRVARR